MTLIKTITLAAIAALPTASFAGNLTPVAPAPAIAAPVDIADWSGAFVGLSVGYGSGDSGYQFSSPTTPHEISVSGGFAGIYGGYDWQVGQSVFGIDASYNASAIEGDRTCPNPSFNCYAEINNFGAIRGRYGRVLDNGALVYGAAGFAFADVTADASIGGSDVFEDPDGKVTGWTIALGMQKMLRDGWAVRGEITHTDYGSTSSGELLDDGGYGFELDPDFTSVTVSVERRF